MGHGYVRNRFGCNCFYGDSSFKRYNRAHGDTVIFNYNWGNNGHCCGGTAKTGFWGGLGFGAGLGLGTGLMNMLGGWLGFGNGGFSMNGLFGGMNFPWGGASGGGFWGANNGWNNGWNSNRTTTTTSETTTPSRNRKADDAGKDGKLDIDNPKFATITAKIKELLGKTNVTQAEIDAVNKELDDALKNTDGIQSEKDKETYNNLKGILNTIKVGANNNGGQKPSITPVPTPTNHPPVVAPEPTGKDEAPAPAGKTPTPAGKTPATGTGEVIIGGKPININDLTPDASGIAKIQGLTADELKNIPQAKAIEILEKLGFVGTENGQKIGKLSNNHKVLLLLMKSGLNVNVENRNASKDTWIKGPITRVAEKDGVLSYDVDCAKTGSYGAKYTFTATDNTNTKYTCKIADARGKKLNVDENQVLIYDNNQKCLINNSTKRALVRQAA